MIHQETVRPPVDDGLYWSAGPRGWGRRSHTSLPWVVCTCGIEIGQSLPGNWTGKHHDAQRRQVARAMAHHLRIARRLTEEQDEIALTLVADSRAKGGGMYYQTAATMARRLA